MLKLHRLSLQRGGKPLFEDASLALPAGAKVGLIGANGSGKSSLFALLQGELPPSAGEIELPPGTIAHAAQETPALAVPAIDFVLQGDRELDEVHRGLAAAERAGDATRIAALHAHLDAIDGYSARARAARLLAGLGFDGGEIERPVAEHSGGWRVRLNLARALMCRSQLLLLDEPTNHLDLDAVLWLEQSLRGYRGMLLMISHDRDLLDGVTDRIAHVERRRIELYSGNYSAFEEQRAARLVQQQAAHAKQRREIAHLSRFVDRFRAKATKARQAQSRLKVLERMERVAPAYAEAPFQFAFRPPERLPDPLLQLDSAAAGYGGRAVLDGVKLDIGPGTRLGLLGPNGAGKSTLIKLLAGAIPASAGRRTEGRGLGIGYFAQHQLEQLRPDRSPLQHLQDLDPTAREQALLDYLGGFGFGGDQAVAEVAPFSGGEKARLALALLVWRRPNLLLLDEPTNHLDLDMRRALTLALQDYAGALVVVSHDRHLLRSTADAFLVIDGGRVQPFDGDLDDYRRWLAGRARSGNDRPAATPGGTGTRRAQRREDAERRNAQAAQRRPLERRLSAVERDLERLNAEAEALETALAQTDLYDPQRKDELRQRLQRQAEARRALERAEEEWLELHEALERL